MKIKYQAAFELIKYMNGMLFALVLWACNASTHSNQSVFRYNEATRIATLDPAFAKNQSIMWVVHQLFNTLVETDSALRIVPSLAKSWDVSPDHMRYTFHLPHGCIFS